MKLILENWRKHLGEVAAAAFLVAGEQGEKPPDNQKDVFALPIKGNCKVNAGFNQRRGSTIHGAIDQNVKPGTPVQAIADGVVTNVVDISQFMKRTNWIIRGLKLGRPVSPNYEGWLKAKYKYFRGRTSKVRKKGASLWKAGVYITIEHVLKDGSKLRTQYMHLRSTSVSKGAHVRKGQTIGASGDTAIIDSKPHLHFVTRINGRRVDPVSIIPELGC